MADYYTDWGTYWDNYFEEGEESEGKVCRYCGEGCLWWTETDTGWRLFEYYTEDGLLNTRMHSCPRRTT